MARTVTSPIVLPVPKTCASSEICDADSASGGLYRLAQSVNTLHVHLRGQLIADSGGVIIAALGQIAQYRCKTIVGDGHLRNADCWAYVTTAGNATLQFRDVAAGTSVNIAIVGATTAWVGRRSARRPSLTSRRVPRGS